MILNKDEQIFLRHIEDLQKKSLYMQSEVFSDFLSVRESAILMNHLAGLPDGRFFLFGGLEESERKMACFHSKFIRSEEITFPISALQIRIAGAKFQKTLPKHSDYLGAILGLGIERRLIGDIYVDESSASAYVLCTISIKDFIISELTSVGRFKVSVIEVSFEDICETRRIEKKLGTVSSLRLDAVISEVFDLSRSKVKDLFSADKIILNGSLPLSLHTAMKEEDIISCRGYGKFIFYEVTGSTKKDKLRFIYGIYS